LLRRRRASRHCKRRRSVGSRKRKRRKRRNGAPSRRTKNANARPSRSVTFPLLSFFYCSWDLAHVLLCGQDKVDAQKAAGTYMTKAEKEKARIKQVLRPRLARKQPAFWKH